MNTYAEQQRAKLSVAASVLLHACFFLLGLKLLVHTARFDVTAGQTSIALSVQPNPTAEVVTPPAPSTPVPVPTPITTAPSTQVTQPVRIAVPVLPSPVVMPPTHITAATPTHQAQPSHPKTSVAKPSDAHQGSTSATADELHNAPPEYPPESQAAGEKGTVMLEVEVTAKGNPGEIHIVHSSGFFRLDQAAREGVAQWRFHPAVIAGIDVPSKLTVPVIFHLK
jgi:periplasmic protein TonB